MSLLIHIINMVSVPLNVDSVLVFYVTIEIHQKVNLAVIYNRYITHFWLNSWKQFDILQRFYFFFYIYSMKKYFQFDPRQHGNQHQILPTTQMLFEVSFTLISGLQAMCRCGSKIEQMYLDERQDGAEKCCRLKGERVSAFWAERLQVSVRSFEDVMILRQMSADFQAASKDPLLSGRIKSRQTPSTYDP